MFLLKHAVEAISQIYLRTTTWVKLKQNIFVALCRCYKDIHIVFQLCRSKKGLAIFYCLMRHCILIGNQEYYELWNLAVNVLAANMETNLNCLGNNYHIQACSIQYIHHCKLGTLNKCIGERFNSTQLSGWNKTILSEIFFSNQLYQFQQCGQGGSLCPLLVYFVLKISRFPRTIWPIYYIMPLV